MSLTFEPIPCDTCRFTKRCQEKQIACVDWVTYVELNILAETKRVPTEALLSFAEERDGGPVYDLDDCSPEAAEYRASRLERLDLLRAASGTKKVQLNRGRGSPGESNPAAVVTQVDVRAIRENTEGRTRAALASHYGISKGAITAIQQRRSWKNA